MGRAHPSTPTLRHRTGTPKFIHKPLLRGRVDGWEFYQGPCLRQFSDGRGIALIGTYDRQETFLDNTAFYVIPADLDKT